MSTDLSTGLGKMESRFMRKKVNIKTKISVFLGEKRKNFLLTGGREGTKMCMKSVKPLSKRSRRTCRWKREPRLVESRRTGTAEWTCEGKPKAKASRGDGAGAPLTKAGAWLCALSGCFYTKPGGTAGVLLLSLQRNFRGQGYFFILVRNR